MFDQLAATEHATAEGCRNLVTEVRDAGAKSALLLVAEGAGIDLPALARSFSDSPIPVTGALFPAVIRGRQQYKAGALALGFDQVPKRVVVDLDAKKSKLEEAVGRLFAGPRSSHEHTVMVVVDGQIGGGAGRLLEVFQLHFHVNASYIGGGAGTSALNPETPCLFTEGGVLPPKSGIALRFDHRTAIEVAHGWSKLAGPFFVSRAEGGVIEELDWKPAIEVYREALIDAGVNPDLSPTGFAKTASLHPLGVLKLKDTIVVRDPVSLTDTGGLYTLGRVPQHSVVNVLRSEPKALLAAASSVATRAAARADGSAPKAFLADCVSRETALGDEFGAELERIESAVGPNLAGALTLGEIASRGDRFVEFFNKTVVVGCR